MKEIQTIALDLVLHSSTTAGIEVDMRKYFVSPGSREMKCILASPAPTEGTDTFSDQLKLQASSTTVDTDFVDLVPLEGAAVPTLVTDAAVSLQEFHFTMLPVQSYLRAYHTIVGVGGYVSVLVQATKRVS